MFNLKDNEFNYGMLINLLRMFRNKGYISSYFWRLPNKLCKDGHIMIMNKFSNACCDIFLYKGEIIEIYKYKGSKKEQRKVIYSSYEILPILVELGIANV